MHAHDEIGVEHVDVAGAVVPAHGRHRCQCTSLCFRVAEFTGIRAIVIALHQRRGRCYLVAQRTFSCLHLQTSTGHGGHHGQRQQTNHHDDDNKPHACGETQATKQFQRGIHDGRPSNDRRRTTRAAQIHSRRKPRATVLARLVPGIGENAARFQCRRMPRALGRLASSLQTNKSGDIDNQRHRTIRKNGRAGNAVDAAIVGFQRLHDSLLLADQFIDEQTYLSAVGFDHNHQTFFDVLSRVRATELLDADE